MVHEAARVSQRLEEFACQAPFSAVQQAAQRQQQEVVEELCDVATGLMNRADDLCSASRQ